MNCNVSVSLVAYKTKKEQLATFLDCLMRSDFSDIFVVDNSPTDELRAFVEKYPSKVQYIFGQGNVGYGSGHNIGIRKSLEKGIPYHLVSNIDISFNPDVIEKIVSFMNRHSDVGALIPRTYYPDGRSQVITFLYPTPYDMIGRRLLPNFIYNRRREKYELKPNGFEVTRNVPIICGCFMFLRTSILEESGLFDENIFMYFEDNDLSRRIHAVSKLAYYPKVSIIHESTEEHRKNKKLLLQSIKSAIYYFNKWGWFFDKERREVNKQAFSDINIIKDAD